MDKRMVATSWLLLFTFKIVRLMSLRCATTKKIDKWGPAQHFSILNRLRPVNKPTSSKHKWITKLMGSLCIDNRMTKPIRASAFSTISAVKTKWASFTKTLGWPASSLIGGGFRNGLSTWRVTIVGKDILIGLRNHFVLKWFWGNHGKRTPVSACSMTTLYIIYIAKTDLRNISYMVKLCITTLKKGLF